MSRNKDIKLLHEITGWSYKECRKKMKENHWDWWKASGYEDAVDIICDHLPNVMEGVMEAMSKLVEATFDIANRIKEIIESIDIEQIIEYSKALEEGDSND